MSPSSYDGSFANVFIVTNTGAFDYIDVSVTYGVRPVINLKSAIAISGSGTTSDPYTIP